MGNGSSKKDKQQAGEDEKVAPRKWELVDPTVFSTVAQWRAWLRGLNAEEEARWQVTGQIVERKLFEVYLGDSGLDDDGLHLLAQAMRSEWMSGGGENGGGDDDAVVSEDDGQISAEKGEVVGVHDPGRLGEGGGGDGGSSSSSTCEFPQAVSLYLFNNKITTSGLSLLAGSLAVSPIRISSLNISGNVGVTSLAPLLELGEDGLELLHNLGANSCSLTEFPRELCWMLPSFFCAASLMHGFMAPKAVRYPTRLPTARSHSRRTS